MTWRWPQRGGRPRRPTLSPMSTRTATLLMVGTAAAAIAGVAVAGAINSGTTNTASNTPLPRVVDTPSPRPTAVVTPHPISSPAPLATRSAKPSASRSSCPTAPAARVAVARRLLRHPGALPDATLVPAGPRPGLLGASDLSARTLTLFVRSCADEPTIQLAFVWGYEAGQFVPIQTWNPSIMERWARLRGISGLPSQTLLRQDVASVFAFWQTGSTRYWHSPMAPPSSSQLSLLVPHLEIG